MKDQKVISINNIDSICHDEENHIQYVFTKDQLINQLQKVCPIINVTFDELFFEEFKCLSSDLSTVLANQFIGIKNAYETNNELLIICGGLLRNSVITIEAATQSLRCGFRLQSGILLRSVIEMCANVVHLLVVPEKLKDFLGNKWNSTYSITIADKQIPLFGISNGILSKHLIHTNSSQSAWFEYGKYNDKEEIEVNVTLGILGIITMILAITTELTFINEIKELKYFEVIEKGKVKFIPPETTNISWFDKLLSHQY